MASGGAEKLRKEEREHEKRGFEERQEVKLGEEGGREGK
jgi:hypothetical protein